jgi:hypothetical protein
LDGVNKHCRKPKKQCPELTVLGIFNADFQSFTGIWEITRNTALIQALDQISFVNIFLHKNYSFRLTINTVLTILIYVIGNGSQFTKTTKKRGTTMGMMTINLKNNDIINQTGNFSLNKINNQWFLNGYSFNDIDSITITRKKEISKFNCERMSKTNFNPEKLIVTEIHYSMGRNNTFSNGDEVSFIDRLRSEIYEIS